MTDQKRFAFFLPNIFTALNIGCGYWAIVWGMNGHFINACMLIVLGAIFDSVDGRVARLTGTESAFGEQFDSLSDLITFGMAPSLIYYQCYLAKYGRTGLVVSFLFVLCGALRLARFNANIEKVSSSNFQGLPIPGAAMCLIGLVMLPKAPYIDRIVEGLAIPYLVFYSFLMISTLPFCSFKDSEWVKKHKKTALVSIFAIIAVLVIEVRIFLVILTNLYVLLSLLYYFKNRKKFQGLVQWHNEGEDSGSSKS